MDDTRKLIVEKKLEALRSVHPEVEYVFDPGDGNLIPCLLEEESKDTCRVTLADGPNTGDSITVPSRHITALGKEFFDDASGKLFK